MSGVNLIPQTVQTAQARRRRLKRWGVSVVASLALLAAPIVTDWVRRAAADDLRRQNDAARTRATALRAELRTLTSEAEQARVHLERATALRSKRAWSSIFSMIADRMPAGCWLTSVATDPSTPTASAAPHTVSALRLSGVPAIRPGAETTVVIDAPRRLMISGFATEVVEPHQFVTSLKETGIFSSVVLERTNREPVLDGWYFRFQLVCEW